MVPPITAANETRRLIIFTPARGKSSTAQILSGLQSKHQSIATLSSRLYLYVFRRVQSIA
jgi:hypothetical protein